jgi:serine/threonine-protein kinase
MPTEENAPMAASPVKPGDVLAGKYRVDRMLGMGCMGVVVAAQHLTLRQPVAIKFMLPGKGSTDEQYTRFLREAQASARLKSEHVARVFDAATLESGAPYLVMELLDGRDLAAELAARGTLPIAEAVDYVLQACEAIAEAHAAGIIHRDIKPANLFLVRAPSGRAIVKVLDFGISKWTEEVQMTHEQAVLGSPLYMSPEQMRTSTKVDARADIWSIGAVLYELIAGQPPFPGQTLMELYTQVNFQPPTPLAKSRPDAPANLEAVLLQCFEKERDRRWPSLAELSATLVPFGTAPRAALSAERIAESLGKQVAPVRPTAVGLPPEPLAAPAVSEVSATANALSRSSAGLVPPKRSRAPLAVGAAVAAVGLVAAGVWLSRGAASGGRTGPAGSGSAIAGPSVTTIATATAPGSATATATAAPSASASATAATAPSATTLPTAPDGHDGHGKANTKTPHAPTATPALRPGRPLYEQ